MKVRGKKATSCSVLDPPEKQLIKINQYNYNRISSMYSVPVQKKLY